MGNGHDYVALDWVRGEIEETLNQARQALEAFAENPEDSAQMRFCLNYIHQVHGTLQMVEFYGAALLAEEMERLSQTLLQGKIARAREAIEVLMQAILQLPGYLEHLHSGRKDLPIVLLPILNDLRASRGESLLSDTSLFSPNLSAARIKAPNSARHRLQDEKMLEHLKKLRQMFQFALAGVIRDKDTAVNIGYMHKVTTRLEKVCQNTAQGQLWLASSGLLEQIIENKLALSSAVKHVLREVEHELKKLVDEHNDILVKPIPEDLLKNILYYIAKTEYSNEKIGLIRKVYELDKALLTDAEIDEERQRIRGPGKDTLSSVVIALNEELARIKDQLDLFVRGEFRSVEDLAELIPGLRQISNTMAVLGLGVPRRVLDDQTAIIQRHLDASETPDDNVIMDIAGALLYVEATLTGLAEDHPGTMAKKDSEDGEISKVHPGQVESAHDAVLREAKNGLEQAKTHIVNYIASHWDKSEIEPVPDLLTSIRGGLQIIPLDKASALLESCVQFIKRVLIGSGKAPDWKQLDTLADAITSIEYYLERLSDGSNDNDMILAVAEESVATLGFPVGETPTYAEVDETEEEQAQEVVAAPISSADKETDKDLIDDEIIEIFVEEAEEVMATISEFYPKYQDDSEDRHALTELRRAFHTLKGSGRLVGATTIGDLAWSIESTLNRLIDRTLQPSAEIYSLLARVIHDLPGIIASFKGNTTASDISTHIADAEAICGSKRPKAAPPDEYEAENALPILEPEIPLVAEAAEEAEDIIDYRTVATLADEQVDESFEEEFTANEAESEPQAEVEEEVEEEGEEDLIDDEIIEIFVEEADEVLATIHEYLPTYLAQPDNREALTELRRAFHTLKGSGRLVGAANVGEIAWAIENILNKIIDGSVFINQDFIALINKVIEILPDLVQDFSERRPASHETAELIARGAALAKGELLAPMGVAKTLSRSATQDDDDSMLIDPVLLEIFKSETETHLATLAEFTQRVREKGEPVAFNDNISRALHTLKGSANTANIAPIAKVAVPIEKFVKDARACNIFADEPIVDILEQTAKIIQKGIDQLEADPQADIAGSDILLKDLAALQLDKLSDHTDFDRKKDGEYQTDPQLISIFLTEGIDILLDAERILCHWQDNPVPGAELEKLVGELTTLAQGARVAGLKDVHQLSDALEKAYERARDENYAPSHEYLETIKEGHEELLNQMDQVAAGLATHLAPSLLDKLAALAPSPVKPAAKADTPTTEAEEESHHEEIASLEDALGELDLTLEETAEDDVPEILTTAAELGDATAPESEDTNFMLDPELVEIFLEEANDLIDSTGELLHRLTLNMKDKDTLMELQRALHTLKGGARLAEIASIGDLSHELESLFERLADGRLQSKPELIDLLLASHDQLAQMVEEIASGKPCHSADEQLQQIKQYMGTGNAPEVQDQTEALEFLEDETLAEDYALPAIESEETEPVLSLALDPELVEIFLEEAVDIINNTSDLLESWRTEQSDSSYLKELQRELHTLKGGARMAEIAPIGDLSHELENLFERLVDGRMVSTNKAVELSLECHDALSSMVESVSSGETCQPANKLIARLKDLLAGNTDDAEIEETFTVDEAVSDELTTDSVEEIDAALPVEEIDMALPSETEEESLSLTVDEPEDIEAELPIDETTVDFEEAISSEDSDIAETLGTDADEAELDDIPLMEMEDEPSLLEEDSQEAEETLDTEEELATFDFSEPSDDNDQDEQIEALEPVSDETDLEDIPLLEEEAEDEISVELPESLEADFTTAEDNVETTAEDNFESASLQDELSDDSDTGANAELDPELAEIFLEEAQEIIDNTGELLFQWRKSVQDLSPVTELQRELHTLKGGARMADVSAIGDLAHEMENIFERMVEGRLTPNENLAELALKCHDTLAGMVDQVASFSRVSPAPEMISALQQALSGEEVILDEDTTEPVIPTIDTAEVEETDTEALDVDTADVEETEAEESEVEITNVEEFSAEQVDNQDADESLTVESSEELIDIESELTAEDAATESEADLPEHPETLADDIELTTEDTLPELEEVEAFEEAAEESHDSFASEEAEGLDPELAEIFLEEARDLIDSTATLLQSWTENFADRAIVGSLQRDLHTLKGGARMADISAIGDLSHELETLFEGIVEGRINPNPDITDLMLQCHDALAGMVEAVGNSEAPQPAPELIEAVHSAITGKISEKVIEETQKLEEIQEHETSGDLNFSTESDNILDLYLDEARESLDAANEAMDQWKKTPDNVVLAATLQSHIQTLKGGAKLADNATIATTCQLIERLLGKVLDGALEVSEACLEATSNGLLDIQQMIKSLSDGDDVTSAASVLADIQQLLDTTSASKSDEPLDEADSEVLEIFLEEANEIIESMDVSIASWAKDIHNQNFNQDLQRALHTLKGGARLANLKALGDEAHSFESILVIAGEHGDSYTDSLKENVQQRFEALNVLVDQVRQHYQSLADSAEPKSSDTLPITEVDPAEQKADNLTSAIEDSTAKEIDERPVEQKPKTAPVVPAVADAAAINVPMLKRVEGPAKPPAPQQKSNQARTASQETIRVSAPLLDELVNLAGETSITRGRLEQQISDFSHTLEEMTATIERLREQLRRMEIETEAQVLFSVEREGGGDYVDFDPLEMDRYSSIQQLSRALSESASDLMDLKDELSEKSRDAETLLLQQSRVNTELQEGLMKTRMIPFSSMVPRLRRIVRQISGELHKKVEFDVHNAEGEMDRNVLERMVAPLEHMLRNALDHGIETTDARKAAGKSESGRIDLSLSREGGDIVLRMKDDGAGIRVDAIRQKAIAQGLIKKDVQLSNHEVLQFIMQAGFSTAQKVTQISGRGVGMDVVASEIKQLGGNIAIDSEVGKGTEFTVRLPFTVSVNRALMVNTGEDFYAIPLNTIEGIVRVSAYELEEYYKPDAPLYEYAGKQYKLHYIGSLLHSEHKPKLQGQALPLPVILVRGGEQSMALQVDSLMGSREIVVKSLGPQFGSVFGASGATILGDGSVVVILDLPALIRAELSAQIKLKSSAAEEAPAPQRAYRPTRVMVVDDSVTVRKVTTRLLQRNGMEVITAKDGVDAVSILQEIKPDIMLLDIEMPRMDGFEVASFVRHDENLSDVPIVMITSRTGQKHRDRAMSIGVNEYLGKPFQEKSLLSTIEKLVKR